MFLGLGHAGFDGWQARETTAGELLSVLYGPCAGVERVALDPLPEMLVERTIGLVSLSRERFVDLVPGRERPLAQRERWSKPRNAFCSASNAVGVDRDEMAKYGFSRRELEVLALVDIL